MQFDEVFIDATPLARLIPDFVVLRQVRQMTEVEVLLCVLIITQPLKQVPHLYPGIRLVSLFPVPTQSLYYWML